MNKKIKLLIISLLVVVFSTGCVKYEGNVEIRKDKSMNYVLTVAVDERNINNGESNIERFRLSEEELSEYKKAGITVEEFGENYLKGYKFVVHYDSINNISTLIGGSEGCNIDPINKKVDDLYCFKREKGYFEDTYKASFILEDFIKNIIKYQDDYHNENQEENNQEETTIIDNSFNIQFTVSVPFEIKSNNADLVKDNTLTWDITNIDERAIPNIRFEFVTPNLLNTIIAILTGALLVFLFISVIISKIINRKSNKNDAPKEEVKEVVEEPVENAKINALLSDDGSNINNL